jgi:hypothetical protein
VGRPSFSRVLIAVTLVAGVALAQQGLIVEPWRKAATPVAATVPPLGGMPSSGLARASMAPEVRRRVDPKPVPMAEPPKWSPPVVELLVDPWARGPAATPMAQPARPRSSWVPTRVDSIDIVDPWADDAPKAAPRVASHRAGPPHSTIF